ncbi:MAG TPA: hypothetical protein VLS94_00800, partial [Fusibacter sp.]|nr:hypothetical protein [Fusibacter sp.]
MSSDKKAADKSYQEFKRVDPNDNNISTKIKISRIGSNEGLEELLKVISQFKKAVPKMGWTTGAKKFDNFELLLQGQLLYRWERIVGQANRTNDYFQQCLHALIKYKVPKDDAFMIQQEHLRNVMKRRTISVSDFAERLEDLNMYSEELPGSNGNAVLDDDELKRILFKAMPKAWRDEFRKSNKSLSTETFSAIRQIMMVYEEIMTPKNLNDDNKSNSSQNKSKNKNNGNANSKNNNGNRNTNNQNHGNNNKGNNKTNNGYKRLDNDDTCPVHGRHKWSECFLNPNGTNYCPRTNNNNTNNNSSNGNNNSSNSNRSNNRNNRG